MPPSSRKCSFDGSPVQRKPAAIYTTLFNEPGERRCYRSYLCEGHADALGPLFDTERKALEETADVEFDTCPGCGQTGFDGFTVTYFDLFIPQLEPRKVELWTCTPCAQRLRGNFVARGVLMPDRDRETTDSRAKVESVWLAYH